MTVAAVVLAAGAATRYGSPKQLVFLPVRARPPRARRRSRDVVVVEGAYPIRADALRAACASSPCPDWALGPGASLRCGLAALGDDVEAALVVLADGPQLDPRAVERLLAHRGRRRRRRRELRRHARPPGRALTRRVGADPRRGRAGLEATLVPCDDLEPPGDMDYPGSLAAARRRLIAPRYWSGVPELREPRQQLRRHRLVDRDLDEAPQVLLEPVALVATRAAREVLLRLLDLLVREDTVEVRLHHRFAVTTTTGHSAHHRSLARSS